MPRRWTVSSRADLNPYAKPALRNLLGVDEGLVIRWDETTLDLFPHGGVAIVRALAGAGSNRARPHPRPTPTATPRPPTRHEQRMLSALARAASPLAVDLLLAQPAAGARTRRAIRSPTPVLLTG
jgi:hypothetical protein